MIDPLAEVVTLLQPSARFSKLIVGAGAWRITRSDAGQPYYCVVLDGSCRIVVGERDVVELQPGDFIMIPAAHDYVVSSREPPPEGVETSPVMLGEGRFRAGPESDPVDVRMLIGHCHFASPDANLLVSLLPRLVHVRHEHRLAALMKLINEESRAQRPARDIVLSRLLEVLFIEALRFHAESDPSPGLVRGLADARMAGVIRAMHERPEWPWTMAELADRAALSRSAFFGRFKRTVGVAPMAYLLAWRMALAKRMLRQGGDRIADIAERTGYRSASAFSVAFTRCVGQSPAQYARNADSSG